jgi:16S rRNA (cytosine1402-N4)-methyltransferase
MTAPGFVHRTVMASELVEAVCPGPGGLFVDVTSGGGGHGESLLRRAPEARLLALDRDPAAVAASSVRLSGFGGRAEVRRATFASLGEEVARSFGEGPVLDGVMADLGVSSPQLDQGERGFSWSQDGPLDMRMSQEGPTARAWLASVDAVTLARCLREGGDVPQAMRLARAIGEAVSAGGLHTTGELAQLCERVLGRSRRSHHPATLVFQAIRIAVNDELGQVKALLAGIPAVLRVGGRVGILTFHSAEDRLVKQTFQRWSQGPPLPRGIPVLGERAQGPFRVLRVPGQPPADEVEDNPRARSARLRAVERCSGAAPQQEAA